MSQLKKEDLKEGEIYSREDTLGNKSIFSYKENICNADVVFKNDFKRNWSLCYYNNLQLATPEEKHHLETCIKEDKFISYEEAMKSFIPEYVECTLQQVGSDYKLDKIYKVKITTNQSLNLIENEFGGMAFYQMNLNRFKPSTKEAYDAQFVVKEPEFVLPEYWAIRITEESYEKLIDWRIKLPHSSGSSFDKNSNIDCFLLNIDGNWQGYWCKSLKDKKHIEITFEQFKKYVLKEETVKEIVEVKPFEILSYLHSDNCKYNLDKKGNFVDCFKHELTINHLSKINSVANQEGNIFMIGDEVISTRSKSKNSNRVSKIVEFRKSSVNDNILAIGDHYYKTGVSIDKIEHYIEPVKVEPEFVLPEKWCVRGNEQKVIDYSNINGGMKPYFISNESYHHYPSFDKPCTSAREIQKGYTEITFEQFKKYVLKETEEVIKPVVKETLLDKAKRLYPVGTRFKNAYNFKEAIVKTNNFTDEISRINLNNGMHNESAGNWTIYNKDTDTWAEIISYEPQVGDKFKINTTPQYGFNHSIKNWSETEYTIVDFKGSYNNSNSIITFKAPLYSKEPVEQTVLLKNIKIIK